MSRVTQEVRDAMSYLETAAVDNWASASEMHEIWQLAYQLREKCGNLLELCWKRRDEAEALNARVHNTLADMQEKDPTLWRVGDWAEFVEPKSESGHQAKVAYGGGTEPRAYLNTGRKYHVVEVYIGNSYIRLRFAESTKWFNSSHFKCWRGDEDNWQSDPEKLPHDPSLEPTDAEIAQRVRQVKAALTEIDANTN